MTSTKEFLLQLNKQGELGKKATFWLNQLSIPIRFRDGKITIRVNDPDAFWIIKQLENPIAETCSRMGLTYDILNCSMLQKRLHKVAS